MLTDLKLDYAPWVFRVTLLFMRGFPKFGPQIGYPSFRKLPGWVMSLSLF